jgi:uncharacterized Zn finger protein
MGDWDWYPRSTPRRPKRAIQARTQRGAFASSWWGKRWIAALESASRDYVNRLGSGRASARAGRVHNLNIAPGVVTATVEDSDDELYAVSLRVDTFDQRVWSNVIAGMSRQALFTAQLLAGEMPREIDGVFRANGRSLFPARQHELETDCSCADWASPCKHVAATHYLLGDALDRDPFLLFELRGRSKEQVLQELGRLRAPAAEPAIESSADAEVDSIAAGALRATPFEQGPEDLPSLSFQLNALDAGAVLRQLGVPAGWAFESTPLDVFLPIYERAGALARELATRSDHDAPPHCEAKARTRKRRNEPQA